MLFPLFASFIIFAGWLTFHLHHRTEVENSQSETYWEKESRANATRRKPLDDLPYISIPVDTLPMDLLRENERIMDCISCIETLKTEKIVNLTGISNTDLKLSYGAPNLPLLARYDQNYTTLARTLQEWGQILYQNEYVEEATTVLEFAVSTKTDVSATYRLLKEIYINNQTPEKINALKETAESLLSVSKDIILRLLEEE